MLRRAGAALDGAPCPDCDRRRGDPAPDRAAGVPGPAGAGGSGPRLGGRGGTVVCSARARSLMTEHDIS